MSDEGWVGVQFRDGGRSIAAGYDCWGLVQAYLEGVCGVSGLPDYGGTPAAEWAAIVRDIAAAKASPMWRKVERREARRGDVVVMTGRERVDGRPVNIESHVGVLVDPKRVLHVEEATASVIVRLDHPSVRHRIAGFYRHRDLQT